MNLSTDIKYYKLLYGDCTIHSAKNDQEGNQKHIIKFHGHSINEHYVNNKQNGLQKHVSLIILYLQCLCCCILAGVESYLHK